MSANHSDPGPRVGPVRVERDECAMCLRVYLPEWPQFGVMRANDESQIAPMIWERIDAWMALLPPVPPYPGAPREACEEWVN